MLGTIIRIDGWDPVAGAAVTLRAASHDDPAVCHLDGATWWPTIATLPKLRYDLFDGAFTGAITSPSSSLSLGIEPWPLFARYTLANARIRITTGEIGTPIAAWTQRFDGRISEQPSVADGRADIAFAVDDRWLDTALLTTYAGTTGAEGSAALKGQVKPLALGAPRYVPGVLIDPVNTVFQISSYGLMQGFEAALERLLRYGPPVADYPSYAALVAAAVPAGRWATAAAVGMARLGAPPTGQISFLVQGDRAGPDGWARKPGQIIRRLALLAGGGGRIDDASLDALDAARPYNLSLYLEQQTTARELIQRIAASVNAVAGVSWNGQLFVKPFAIGTGSVTLAADGSALPPVGSVKQVGMPAPYTRLAITAERAWTVHALSDIAFTAELLDLGPYAAGTTYREGNIVQYQGSSWLYRNPAPSAGNAPPGLPVEQDMYWQVLARAGQDGRDGTDGADGLNGVDGRDGTDGRTPQFHFAWSDASDGSVNFTTGDQGGRIWQGVYVDFDPGSDSANPASYTWSLFRGQDGTDGIDGADGTKIHKAYANSPDGTVDFHLSDPTGRRYLGLRVDYQIADSTNPADYGWSLIKGDTGARGLDAPLVTLTPTPALVSYDAADLIKAGDYVFRAELTNAIGPVAFAIVNHPVNYPGVTVGADTLTITAARMQEMINYDISVGRPAQCTVTATASGASPARATISKVKDGRDGTSADDMGLGLRADGAATINIPANGNTTVFTAVNAGFSALAGRKLRLTLGASNVSFGTGGDIVFATIVATIAYQSGGSATLFSGLVSVSSDGSIDDTALTSAAANLAANPGSGNGTLTITYQRGGPGGVSASFRLAFVLERL